jgi:hypothetical protein
MLLYITHGIINIIYIFPLPARHPQPWSPLSLRGAEARPPDAVGAEGLLLGRLSEEGAGVLREAGGYMNSLVRSRILPDIVEIQCLSSF